MHHARGQYWSSTEIRTLTIGSMQQTKAPKGWSLDVGDAVSQRSNTSYMIIIMVYFITNDDNSIQTEWM